MRMPLLQRRMRALFRSFIRADPAILVDGVAAVEELLGIDPPARLPFRTKAPDLLRALQFPDVEAGIYFGGAIRQLRVRAELRRAGQPDRLPQVRKDRRGRGRRPRGAGREDPLRLSFVRAPPDGGPRP